MKHDSLITEMSLDNIEIIWSLNPREDYDEASLASRIIRTGEFEGELWVNHRVGNAWADDITLGQYILMKGHRSSKAVRLIQETSVEVYNNLFPDGNVPTRVFEGLTLNEESHYRNDHMAVKPLDSDLELFWQMENLIANGMSFTDVCEEMTPAFRKGSGRKSKHYLAAMAEVDLSKRAQHLRKAWTGRVRIPWWLSEMNPIAREHYVSTLQNGVDNPVPALSNDRVVELHAAWFKEKEAVAKAIAAGEKLEPISKENNGRAFEEVWTKFVEEDMSGNVKSKKSVRSVKQVDAYAAKVNSKGVRKLLTDWFHGSDVQFGQYDTLYHTAELVSTFFPDFWKNEVLTKLDDAKALQAEAKAKADAIAEAKAAAQPSLLAVEAVKPVKKEKASKK